MKNANQAKLFLFIGCVLFLGVVVGCGKAHTVMMKAPGDLGRYSMIYVENADVASKEQDEKIDEANAKYAQYAREQIITALKEKARFEILDGKSTTDGSLTLQTTVRIVYGNRAARYFIGYGAGTGSIDITMKLVDSSTNETEMEMHSNSRLSVGVFGGDMDDVIEKSIDRVVEDFVAEL